MKKKIFILFVIIVFSFSIGLYMNFVFQKEEKTDDGSIILIGTIEDITNNVATVRPDDDITLDEENYFKFNLPEGEESLWVVGDIIKATYFPENMRDDEKFIDINTLESIGKARLFDPKNLVPVSNADHRGNGIVFKSFFAYDNSIPLETFSIKSDFYYRKITKYSEYEKLKKQIPELRTLTENDFINYYLLIVLSEDINTTYMFNGFTEKEKGLDLEILKGQNLSDLPKKPIYSGLSVVIPNVLDTAAENINFTIAK